MIKVIAFDLVGVLVNEKDIELTKEEEKLERMFGPNIDDAGYMQEARKIFDKDSILMRTTEDLIEKLYKVRTENLFKNIKEINNDVRIIIATNHVSFVRGFIGENLEADYLDDVLISAEMHKIKPNSDFYEHILNKFNIKPEELLFVDDNIENVKGAEKLGIKTIKVNKDTDILKEVEKFI